MRHNIRFISRKKVCQVVFELVLMSLSGFLFQKRPQLECTFLTNSQEEAEEEQCSISIIVKVLRKVKPDLGFDNLSCHIKIWKKISGQNKGITIFHVECNYRRKSPN